MRRLRMAQTLQFLAFSPRTLETAGREPTVQKAVRAFWTAPERRACGLVFPFRTEREGFEPSVPLRVHATSNRAPSAARSSLQVGPRYYIDAPEKAAVETSVEYVAYSPERGGFGSRRSRPGSSSNPPRPSSGDLRIALPPSGRRGARFESPDERMVGHFPREGDSNPRNPYGFNGFRDRPIQPLSHLSKAMRLRGFEPPTFRSAIWRSIQLSYSLARIPETADPSTALPSSGRRGARFESHDQLKKGFFRRGGDSNPRYP